MSDFSMESHRPAAGHTEVVRNKLQRRAFRRDLPFVVLVAVLLFATAVAMAIRVGASSGSVPDWIAAIATLGGLAAATLAALFAARSLKIEQDRDDIARENLRREQAEKIGVWRKIELAFETRGTEYWGTIGAARLFVKNGSDLPVFDIEIDAEVWLQAEGTPAIGPKRLHATPDVLEPGQTFSLALISPFSPGVHVGYVGAADHTDYRGEMTVSTSFTDAAGQRWTRDARAALRRAPGLPDRERAAMP